jgi:hypothetical protein
MEAGRGRPQSSSRKERILWSGWPSLRRACSR